MDIIENLDIKTYQDTLSSKYLISTLGDMKLGFNLMSVLEIITMRPINDMPNKAPGVKGFITLRDSVIPVINVRERIGWADKLDNDKIIIIVESKDERIGLIVDDVRDVIEVLPEKLLDPPEMNKLKYINAIINIADDDVVMALDCEKFIEALNAEI